MLEQQNTKRGFNVKQVIFAALLFMMLGTSLELYLIHHYEDTQQLIPLLCIAIAILGVFILFYKRTKQTFKIFKFILIITALSGVYGIFLHLQVNFEFEKEMTPTATNWELCIESLSGALPALAPASMIVLALIGYAYLLLLKQK